MRKICSIFFITFILHSHAQHFNYRLHGESSGLYASQVFDLLEDKRGFIWAGTASGVFVYDGYNFSSVLPDTIYRKFVFKVYEDLFGRIWFLSYTGELRYYYKSRVYNYKYNDRLLALFKNNRYIIRDFSVLADSTILIGLIRKQLLKLSPGGEIKITGYGDTTLNDHYVLEENRGEYISYSKAGPGKEGSTAMTVYVDGKNVYEKRMQLKRYNNNCFYIKRRNGHVVFTAFGSLVDLYRGMVKDTSSEKSDVISLYEDSDSCLWVGYLDGGVKKIAPNKPASSKDYRLYFLGNQVSKVLEDSQHGFWFATLYNGLVYVPSKNLECFEKNNFSLDKEDVYSIATDGISRIFVGTRTGQLKIYQGGRCCGIHQVSKASSGSIRELFYDKVRQRLYIGCEEGLFHLDKGLKPVFESTLVPTRFLSAGQDVYISSYASRIVKNFDFARDRHIIFSKAIRILCMAADKDGRIWVGAREGLFYIAGQRLVKDETLFGNIPVLDMLQMSGKLCIFTARGIFRWDGKTLEEVLINGKRLQQQMGRLLAQNDSILWVSTNSGLYKKNMRQGKTLFSLNKKKGLYADLTREFVILNDTGYALTFDGVCYFDLSKSFYNDVPPPIYIQDFRVDTVNYAGTENPVLDYNKNYITVRVVGLAYRQAGSTVYAYRLKGYSDAWQKSSSTLIQYASLSPGSYTFEVKAENEDGVYSAVPAVFPFVIRQPLWKRLWFQLLLLLLIAIITAVILYARIKGIKKANKIMEQLSNYKQQALSMQMNPHFIFNSLNSIQAYVLSEKPVKAAKYLAVFSKLMRKSLDNSRKEFIHLEEEVSTLELYLQLEANRAKGLFDFWFEYDKEKLKNIMVPPMLIQPHIENAIKHGFHNQREKQTSSIKISFVMSNDSLYCFVEDNGVGVKSALAVPESRTSIYKSAGIEVTRTRLELLCKNLGFEFYFEIKDRADHAPGESGTSVEFLIPYVYEAKSIDS